MSQIPGCRFCLENKLFEGNIVIQSDTAYMVRPQGSERNLLIIPKDHIESPLILPDSWWASLKELLAGASELPESYNISLNYGKPAGQTQKHLHFWIIGRNENEKASGIGLAKLITHWNET